METCLVTGGAGFIGSSFVLAGIRRGEARIINLDRLTYAGNLMSLESVMDRPSHVFIHGDIADSALVAHVLQSHRPTRVVNFAAESHVDRSIADPEQFIQTNVVGTHRFLGEVLRYFESLSSEQKEAFRFLHVSTDEVYGSLGPTDPAFHERTPYAPNSPYSASKAASDHLVRAYHHTYGLPTLTTNCSNNYGPRQFPEKLIPLIILNALDGKPLPIYGDGLNVRDWLYVGDHCDALDAVLTRGGVGETYNIGGCCEKTNLDVVRTICQLLDSICPDSPFKPHESLITFVKDRPGHDRRYAIDSSKIEAELQWKPKETFESGIERTIQWYLDHPEWVASVRSGAYREWVATHYGQVQSP